MAETFASRLRHAWNAFRGLESTDYTPNIGQSYSYRPDRVKISVGSEKTIITAIYNKIALDVAAITIQHVRLDENERFKEVIKSPLNSCLTLEANIDQTGRAFMQDVVMSMFEEGVVAIVPVDTSLDPRKSTSYEINTMRTGKIVNWYPRHVRIRLYNDQLGVFQEITIAKSLVAIIENPLYAVMNEPNSTLKRLVYKLNLLDAIDKQSGAGKLDLIIQLPYVIKSTARKEQAEARRKAIADQLEGSQYGIAYTDGTERITQLNRPTENNLMSQIEYLTRMLHSQLGLTEKIFDGTADEKEMLNYHNRTVSPILAAITGEMKRKFLTKTARSQGQSIIYYRNPFDLVPVTDLADIADKFTRNEILSSNEFRAVIGFKPANDPKADELRNKNITAPNGEENQNGEEINDEKESINYDQEEFRL